MRVKNSMTSELSVLTNANCLSMTIKQTIYYIMSSKTFVDQRPPKASKRKNVCR